MMKLSINSSTTSRPRLASVAWTFLLLSLGPIPSPWNANFHGITSSSGSHGPFLFANAAANDVANDNNPIVISESNTEDGPNDDDASDSISDARDGDTSSQGDDLGVSAANDGHNRRSSSDNHNNNHRSNDNNNHSHLLPNDPALTPDSVVLITGAAGFLGSELALSLRRAYGVRKLLLVDHLGIPSANEGQYVPPSPSDREAQAGRADGAVYEALTEEDLSLFEYKRQRAFRLFHELTASPPAVMGEGGRRMDDDAESLRFYRADMRPSIPEFFDFGEVPLLEGIFQSNPDITHVVHLADVPESVNQAVPRSKDSVKAGRMEGVLEELRLLLERRKKEAEERGNLGSDGGGDSGENGSNVAATLPHFVYASSADVYDVVSTAEESGHPNPPPFREDKPITTPSTLRGASKLIDEVLASAYHSTHGIYSVGLRFFPVYGPWATPGTEVFDLVERVIAENDDQAAKEDAAAADSGASATNTAAIHSDRENIYDGDTKDYVFIDDAVDAILSAMQYRPPGSNPPPVVFNVGTGRGSTLHDLYTQLISHFPQLSGATSSHTRRPASSLPHFSQRRPTKSIASTHRSELHLGFRPQTPLSEGLAHTLAWHRDRTFPYGRDPDALESFHRQGMDAAITHSLETSRGDNGRCSPLDRECLRGAPVFPCASECRRAERCTPSAWDDVAVLSKMVTTGCDAVLYTVLLDDAAEKIPSASTAIGTDSMPYVGAGLPADIGAKTQVRCNIAFVSEASPLVRRLKAEGEEYLEREESGLPPLLRHGFWTVLPVKTPSSSSSTWLHAFAGTFALEYLPKVSPARFFGSSVRYAAYADSNLIIDNLPRLLKKMEDGPPVKNGSTSLMLAEKTVDCDPTHRGSTCEWTRLSKNDSIQSGVYNMVRVALRGEILGGGLHPVIDSSFLIHSLREEESRLFRCDAYSEAAQWGASGDERSLEFIVSLHDLWSRAVSHWAGVTPWWRSYSPASAVESEEEGSANNGVGEEGNGGNTDDEASRRRLSESSDGNQGTFFGVLSTGENQFFTQIVPSESLGVVLLDEYHRQ